METASNEPITTTPDDETFLAKDIRTMNREIEQIGERLLKRISEREATEPVQLAMWPERELAAPNELSRSSLFPAVHPKKRAMLFDAEIATQGGVTVRYTGPQLDQSYFDVFQGVMHYARGQDAGTEVQFRAVDILRLIGRTAGGSDRRWLYLAFQALTATSVAIVKDGRAVFWGSLLPSGKADLETGSYVVTISRELAGLFGRGFTRVEWAQRRKLFRRPLARWLQLYYASHAKPHPVSVSFLRELSGSTTQSERKFKQNLKLALAQITEVGVITGWSIDDRGLVRVERESATREIVGSGVR